jgi:hypothetical protein
MNTFSKCQAPTRFGWPLFSAIIRSVPLAACLVLFSSCTALLSNVVIEPSVTNLQRQQDVDLVCEGAASYLLMLDSLVADNPTSRTLLLIATKAYSGTAEALRACDAPADRIMAMSGKARNYGKRLLATRLPMDTPYSPEFEKALESQSKNDAELLFWGGFGWLSWITQQQGSPAALADLIVVEKIMARVLGLDETVEQGSPHLFFGALYGAKPVIAGGNPDKSRFHFERALEISDRRFLIIQTTFAQTYARMTMNQALHDSLLAEVIDFDINDAPEHALSNQIARRTAQALLDENYFGD